MNLFSYFLREIYDEDSLLFYLHLRHTTQQEFGLSLKLKQKLLHPNATKKFHADGTIVLKAHPLIHDGSQLVHLSKHACKRVTTKFLRSSKGTNYLIEQKFPECFTTVKTESGSQVSRKVVNVVVIKNCRTLLKLMPSKSNRLLRLHNILKPCCYYFVIQVLTLLRNLNAMMTVETLNRIKMNFVYRRHANFPRSTAANDER